MSSTTNNPYLVKSMNGTITIDDGEGTVIENGTIITNDLELNILTTNEIQAKTPTTSCEIWPNVADSYYSQNATGPTYFALGATGNINLGALSTQVSTGAVNIATSSGYGGTVTICASAATNSKIKLQAPLVECPAAPTTGNGVVNRTYALGLTAALLAATNIWTGLSNTFQNVIYTALISPITSLFSLGSSGCTMTLLQNSEALIVAQFPLTLVNTGLPVSLANNGMRFFNTSSNSMIDFFSSGLGGNNAQSSRIRSFGGTAAANTGALTIDSGSIAVSATAGTLGLYSDGMAITANTGDINISATAGVVAVEGLVVSGTNVYPVAAASTVNFLTTNTSTLNIGNSATAVNIGGTRTNLAVNGNYSLEVATGGGTSFLDFHAYGPSANDYDARIFCDGASAGTATGLLQIISANTRFTGGISFAKGNLSAASFIQTYSTGLTGIAIAANSNGPVIVVNFAASAGASFLAGTIPSVTVTPIISIGSNAVGLVFTTAAVSATQFYLYTYNAKAFNILVNTWGYSYTAIGRY